MSTVRKNIRQKKVVVTKLIDEESISIELSKFEAAVLATILARVGGALNGPRGVASDLYSEINTVMDVNTSYRPYRSMDAVVGGSIFFETDDRKEFAEAVGLDSTETE